MYQRHAVKIRPQPLLRRRQRRPVAVHADQAAGRQALDNFGGMARAAERPVEINSVGAEVQRLDALVQKDGFMKEFHQKPSSSITAAMASGVRYLASSAS